MSTVEATVVLAPNHEMVLQLATDRQVHAFDLGETFRVGVGRHHSNDLQLRSRRVSNYHAEIVSEVGGLFVRDMGSTNGTYVNDESIRKAKLKSGDRIRIGGFHIEVRLIPRKAVEGPEGEGSSGGPECFAVGSVGNILPFRGPLPNAPGRRDPSDTTLPDLLSELSRRKASVVAAIRLQKEEGRIYVREGAVIHCELGCVRRQKALFRILAQQKGTYEIHELPAGQAVPRTIDVATDALVVEGMQQVEALEQLTAKLPPMMYEVALNAACELPVKTLTAEEFELYQQLIRYQTVVRALEESPMTDFMVLFLGHGLLQKGFFLPTKTPGATLEETSVSKPQGP